MRPLLNAMRASVIVIQINCIQQSLFVTFCVVPITEEQKLIRFPIDKVLT